MCFVDIQINQSHTGRIAVLPDITAKSTKINKEKIKKTKQQKPQFDSFWLICDFFPTHQTEVTLTSV